MPVPMLANLSSNKTIVEFGKLALGSPKRKYKDKNGNEKEVSGENLDYFRVDFNPHYKYLESVFNEIFGNKPRQFDVELVGDMPDDVFPNTYSCGTRTKLLHLCNGAIQATKWDETTQTHIHNVPCEGGEPDFKCGCKLRGELHVTIPKFNEAIRKTGKFVIRTGSFDNATEIYPRLQGLYLAFGSLMFMPATIGRYQKPIMVPMKEGRAKKNTWLMYIDFDNDLLQQAIITRRNAQLQKAQYQALFDEPNYPQLPDAQGQVTTTTPQPQLPQPENEEDEPLDDFGVDLETIADWIQEGLKTNITITDVSTALKEAGYAHDDQNPNANLDAVACVLEYWCQDPETGQLVIDDVQKSVNALFSDEGNRQYVMDKVVG